VPQILEAGANVNITEVSCQTPLHLAAEDGDFRTARILIKYGANLKRRDKFGRTCALGAFTSHQQAMVRYLVSQGVPDNFPRQVNNHFANRLLGADAEQQVAENVLTSVWGLDWTEEKDGTKMERLETWGEEIRSIDGAGLDRNGSTKSIMTQHGLLSRTMNRPIAGFYRAWSEAMQEGARRRLARAHAKSDDSSSQS
jgi:hypothetical protein